MEVVTGALPSLLPKLGDLLVGEYKLQRRVKGEIMFLQAELESMKVALEKLSEVPADCLDEQDKIWARDVRELSYDIEDSIDTFMVRGKGTEPPQPHGFKKFIDRSLGLLTRAKTRRKIATDFRDIKSRVIEVSERRDRYRISSVAAQPVNITFDPRLFTRYTKAAELVGIADTRDELIKVLMGGNQVSKQQDKILSIVGFGGLGKTTLANAVYEKLRVQFDCSAFVSVSQNPNMDKLFEDMLYQLAKKDNARINCIHEIREFLQSKRYFIVLDDIWDISIWKMMRCAMPDNNGGYRIITTTRNFNVAKQVGDAYMLKPLCLHDSRILLYRRIFGSQDNDTCSDGQLAEVSNRILKKCAGIPLAIITIASLLGSKGGNIIEWYKVYNSVGTGLENNVDVRNMRKILSLSYYDMPSQLRTCLLYLSMFLEDSDIRKDCLIWMWIAEGFIQCEEQGMSLFDVGESYFNELISRNLIQPVYDESSFILTSCRVHDMVLDLIRSLSSGENFITVLNDVSDTSGSKRFRRLSLQNSEVNHLMHGSTKSMQHVRSVIVFPSAINIVPALPNFRVLRVLEFKGCDLSQGFDLRYLGKLFHLRYLGLQNTCIGELPQEIGNLGFLQTLDVTHNVIHRLPSSVIQLRGLMCLRISDATTRVPDGIGTLTALEELSTLDIDNVTMHIIEELGQLTELRVLRIKFCVRWNDTLEKSLVDSLYKLQKIHTLDIMASYGDMNLDLWVAPPSLRRLKLLGCWFSMLPFWLNPSQLHNLTILYISLRELQQEDLQILGRLPALCYLNLKVNDKNLNIPRSFTIVACSFPSLVVCELWGFVGSMVFRQGAMPRVTRLLFTFNVGVSREIAGTGYDFDLGLGHLTSLQHVTVLLRSGGASKGDVKEAKGTLRHASELHPNNPTVEIC